MKKCARETADLKFLNNQYVHKLKLMEKESKAKNEKIQQLQEKNLQAVVQTPGESVPSQNKLCTSNVSKLSQPLNGSTYPPPIPKNPPILLIGPPL